MPKRSISQRIGDKAELICETAFLDAPNWIPRRQEKDFGVDLEAELTLPHDQTEILTGKLVKIQVKGSVKPLKRDNAIWVRLSKEYMRYSAEFRVPVLLISVNIKSGDAYYVWLQEYQIANPVTKDAYKSSLVKIPLDNRLVDGLVLQIPDIARGNTGSARLLAFRELVEIFRQSNDFQVFRSLLAILKAFEPDQDNWLFEKTLDQLMELGPNVGAWQTQEHSHVLIEVCRTFGDKLTKDQVIRMTQRGETYSRAGLSGLTALFDSWPDKLCDFNLAEHFEDEEVFDVSWYCQFREYHRGKTSLEIWNRMITDLKTDFPTGLGVLEISTENRDYAYRKWPNRADSAYLDCLSASQSSD